MKKILLSLGVIGVVGAIAITSTGAFFSDNETSAGNTFTAGAIDLKVDSTSHYNNMVCTPFTVNDYRWQPEPGFVPGPDQYPAAGTACSGTWTLTDLGPTNQFFNFPDIKPGDQGENTVSLHIENNPAYACAYIQTTGNAENTYTGPEISAGDVSSTTGELAQNVNVFAWSDVASTSGAVVGDNIWQAGEPVLAGPVSLSGLNATTTLPLADSVTNGGVPLSPGVTNYVGVAWCVGAMNTSVPGTITCNGAAVSNQAQTDSVTANVTFHVEQSRNNSNFKCNTPTVVGANDLETSLANVVVSGKWYFYNDTADVLDNTLGTFVVGPATPPLGTGSALVNPLLGPTGRTLLTNSSFGGTLLSNISAMSYSYFQPAGAWSASEAPFLRFNVDFAGSPAYQGSLVYVPSTNGAVTQGLWQTANTVSGGALWLYSGASWPAPNAQPGTTPNTWAQILADYPSIRMHPLFPQVGVRVGEPGPVGLTANLDNFSVTISGITKAFDFGN